jgi:hypothetical protein
MVGAFIFTIGRGRFDYRVVHDREIDAFGADDAASTGIARYSLKLIQRFINGASVALADAMIRLHVRPSFGLRAWASGC